MNANRKLFNLVNLHGEGCFRSVTLALPTAQVLRFLPAGLVLGPQDVTPPGTHPVILSFNALYRAEMSVPTLLPSLTYHEFTFGVPFSYLPAGRLGRALGALTGRRSPAPHGPYYYMPRLFLDSVLATLGGLLFWGYAKKLARFTVGADRFAIQGEDGAPQVSLAFSAQGEPQPVAHFPHFAAVQAMLAQPLVSQLPAALGPIFVVADFDKQWHQARLRPLVTQVQVLAELVPGFGPGSHPAGGVSDGIDVSVLGSYELNAPWLLGMPHVPLPRPDPKPDSPLDRTPSGTLLEHARKNHGL